MFKTLQKTALRALVFILQAAVFSACATIIKGSHSAVKLIGVEQGEPIEVFREILHEKDSVPVELVNGKQVIKLPANSNHIIVIRYKGEEKKHLVKQIPGTGWIILNLLLGGFIGFVVDGATGYWHEFADIIVANSAPVPGAGKSQ